MKTIEELEAIRQKALENLKLRGSNNDKIRIVVGMATCGIAAGAKKVLNAFIEEIGKRKLDNVVVSQTGCIGLCRLEPLVEVFMPGESEKYTYVNINEEKVKRIVAEHIVNNNPCKDLLIKS